MLSQEIFPLYHNPKENLGLNVGSNSNLNVGILLQGSKQRRLQKVVHMAKSPISASSNHQTLTLRLRLHTLCGLTCKPSTCNCVYIIFWSSVEINLEIDAICNGLTDEMKLSWLPKDAFPIIHSILNPDYQEYVIYSLCSFFKRVVNGGTLGSCRCHCLTNCEMFGDEHHWYVIIAKILVLSYTFVN